MTTEPKFLDMELVDLMTNSDILPFCVYHWVDPDQGVYLGYLGGPEFATNESGQVFLTCGDTPPSSNPYGRWKKAFTFYAINPALKPIPFGMSLFCAKRSQEFPWNTTEVKSVYDQFNIDNQCVYFIAYTMPVPFTTPLFLHQQEESSFPSLDPNPPRLPSSHKQPEGKLELHKKGEFDKDYIFKGLQRIHSLEIDRIYDPESGLRWKREEISPIYVLSPDDFGNEYWNIKFICNNTRSIPYLPQRKSELDDVLRGERYPIIPSSLRDSVIRCNQLVSYDLSHTKKGMWDSPFDILDLIKDELSKIQEEHPTVEKRIGNTSPLVIAIVIGLFVVLLSVIIYMVLTKKGGKSR
jgi:hypothetical protein